MRETYYRHPAPIFILLTLLLGKCGVAVAQSDAMTGLWQETTTYYNPSLTGTRGLLVVTALYRQQWIGIKGAPAHMTLFGEAPFERGKISHGVGISFVGQKKGLFTTVDAKAQYAFILSLMKGKLAAGVELGLVNSAFDGTKVFIPDGEGLSPSDPAIPTTQVSGRGFDAGVGISFTHQKFFIGIGAKHLFAPKILLGTNHYFRLSRTYNAIAGYNFSRSSSLLSWHPSCLLVTDFRAFRIDVGLTVGIAGKYFAGLMYRPNNAAGFNFRAEFGKVRIGYAFEMPISELARGNYGTHEVCLSYVMPMPKKRDKGLSKKSIRLL